MPRIEEVKLKRVGLQWVGVRVGVRWVVGRDEGLLHLTSYFAMVSVAPARPRGICCTVLSVVVIFCEDWRCLTLFYMPQGYW